MPDQILKLRILKDYPLRRIQRAAVRRVKKIKRIFKPIKSKIFVSTIPKSGTNLLSRALFLLLDTDEYYYFDIFSSPAEIAETLKKGSRGGIVLTHSFLAPQTKKLLKEHDFKILLILRDPRDTVVSLIHYIISVERPIMQNLVNYYKKLPDNNKRLMAAIIGVESKDIGDGQGYAGVAEWYRSYLEWLSLENICVVRFENLIGPKGGGSRDLQIKEIDKIIFHLGLSVNRQQIEKVADKLFDIKNSKFRKGQIGNWKEYFTPEHKKAFKRVAGQILIDLGYEKDFNW